MELETLDGMRDVARAVAPAYRPGTARRRQPSRRCCRCCGNWATRARLSRSSRSRRTNATAPRQPQLRVPPGVARATSRGSTLHHLNQLRARTDRVRASCGGAGGTSCGPRARRVGVHRLSVRARVAAPMRRTVAGCTGSSERRRHRLPAHPFHSAPAVERTPTHPDGGYVQRCALPAAVAAAVRTEGRTRSCTSARSRRSRC